MEIRRKKLRLRLLLMGASLTGCFAASLSGALTASARAGPIAVNVSVH